MKTIGFDERFIPFILNSDKTTTYRPVEKQPDEHGIALFQTGKYFDRCGREYKCKYQKGDIVKVLNGVTLFEYPINLKITEVELFRLMSRVTIQEVIRDGFRSSKEYSGTMGNLNAEINMSRQFREFWDNCYPDMKAATNPWVWRISFELIL